MLIKACSFISSNGYGLTLSLRGVTFVIFCHLCKQFLKKVSRRQQSIVNSFHASNDLLSAENLCKRFGPDPNCLVFLKEFLKKLILNNKTWFALSLLVAHLSSAEKCCKLDQDQLDPNSLVLLSERIF